jgi:hypothetical protein
MRCFYQDRLWTNTGKTQLQDCIFSGGGYGAGHRRLRQLPSARCEIRRLCPPTYYTYTWYRTRYAYMIILPRQARDKTTGKTHLYSKGHVPVGQAVYCSTKSGWEKTYLAHCSLVTPAQVMSNRHFLRRFLCKNASFCRDRLGTNIGKALKKE